MKVERKVKQMGIQLPGFGRATYYGASYGKIRPFHRTGKLVLLSGTSPRRTGRSSIQVGSGRT
jgi:hypothetical protein